MILLGTGYATDFAFILFVLFLFILSFKKKLVFKILAKINKVILPSLYNKDITNLKSYQKLLLAYRYWVTKNSL